jgi:hypothetical protein
MAYSRAYQVVIAGRTREDELGFFKLNQVASPARVFSMFPLGGKKQPTVDSQYLEDNAVGKASGRKPLLSAFNPNGNNIG